MGIIYKCGVRGDATLCVVIFFSTKRSVKLYSNVFLSVKIHISLSY